MFFLDGLDYDRYVVVGRSGEIGQSVWRLVGGRLYEERGVSCCLLACWLISLAHLFIFPTNFDQS